MGSKKTTQQNEYRHYTPPDTQDTRDLREMSKHADFSTPIIGAYGNMKRDIDHQIFESDLPEGVQERIKNAQMFHLGQNEAQALSAAAGQEHLAKTGNTATLAGLTRPQLVNSSSTTVQPFDWMGLGQAGLMGAGTALS